MSRPAEIAVTTGAAALLYLPVTLVLTPPPIPSMTTLVGGLVGLWLGRGRRLGSVAVGGLAGLAVGAFLHARSHVVEGRAEPRGEFALHVLADAGLGLAIAGVVLALTFALRARLAGPKP